MANLKDSLATIMELDGAITSCVVDYESGMALGSSGSGIDLELTAAGISEVVKTQMKNMKALGSKGDIEDILITLDKEYHIIRPMVSQKGLVLFVILDKAKSSLALARRRMLDVEGEIKV